MKGGRKRKEEEGRRKEGGLNHREMPCAPSASSNAERGCLCQQQRRIFKSTYQSTEPHHAGCIRSLIFKGFVTLK